MSVCVAATGATSKVTAVHFWCLGGVTHVAIDVPSEFRYSSDRRTDPEQIFFDIQAAKPQMAGRGMQVIAVGDPLLKQIRVAEIEARVTRVVLDLERSVEFTASQLSNPDRLMIELRLKNRPTRSVDAGRKSEPSPAPAAPRSDPKPESLRQPTAALTAKLPKELPTPADGPKTLPRVSEIAPTPHGASDSRPAPGLLPAKTNSNGDRSLTRVLGLKVGRVALDPGHGGHDVGTFGPSGLYEKVVVLDVAQRLGALLEERQGTEVIYTRSDDSYVPLEERTRIANERKADLFLSIHANSSTNRSAAGVETYYLSLTTSKTALALAARENASSSSLVFDLSELLQKVALNDKIDESHEVASRLQTALYSFSAKGNAAARNRGVKKAPFVVLIGASMPSVLAEIGFLTNSADEALLRKPEQRQKIAEALYQGIASYAETLSHFQAAKPD